ncbi:branched-chain amino-acid aminotransferase [Campylobacter pinnipediorum subsp. caledonicus]|uniref:Branched-chain-amino-acid aminotransferase n=1 Tax=Campylobacter pinnipediorum subsp. caledonicus TaxID=1874362 RepID=A0A1S6U9F0_9BACT|nr:branched-chain amino acid transaminase [Campylobacter pinnipediorum]AQW86710.1 branched-chain amino-acid aminotransferase [Campylobacter pinnipediorum subsp. caledonicus]AQW88361.1 branched-chain amino-acid aminotransferase [Campylobacter pinnipediorum subsp. caledonicus]OPA71730.1 branched-chain amino acid aminotransferase [Campylobacter pinnipediorum subsp. caledonicus]
MNTSDFIWMDGKLVKWDDAKVHVLTHSLHYANAVFEGTRAYKTDKGLAIFRLKEHTKRLLNSAKMTAINVSYTQKELEDAQIQVLKANNFDSNVYIRPLIYLGYGVMGVSHTKAPVNTAIAAWEWGAYLGEDGLTKGIKVKISSFARNSIKSQMGKAKASSNYLNSQMANYEAKEAGYDEALLLDEDGFVAEGSGECFFIIQDGVLISPPNDNSLVSITQDTVIKIAKDLGIEVRRERITRDQAYTADEAFFTGTAAEVTPISNIDARIIGSGVRGEITKKIQDAYFDVVYGRNEKYASFLTYI